MRAKGALEREERRMAEARRSEARARSPSLEK
jgi:hypothetical protein